MKDRRPSFDRFISAFADEMGKSIARLVMIGLPALLVLIAKYIVG